MAECSAINLPLSSVIKCSTADGISRVAAVLGLVDGASRRALVNYASGLFVERKSSIAGILTNGLFDRWGEISRIFGSARGERSGKEMLTHLEEKS